VTESQTAHQLLHIYIKLENQSIYKQWIKHISKIQSRNYNAQKLHMTTFGLANMSIVCLLLFFLSVVSARPLFLFEFGENHTIQPIWIKLYKSTLFSYNKLCMTRPGTYRLCYLIINPETRPDLHSFRPSLEVEFLTAMVLLVLLAIPDEKGEVTVYKIV
jgi:hypothetical protein